MKESPSIVVEHIDSSAFMSRSRESAINGLRTDKWYLFDRETTSYEVDAQAEASFCLKFADFYSIRNIIPNIDPSIEGCGGKILSIFRQGYCPYLTCLVPIYVNVSLLYF